MYTVIHGLCKQIRNVLSNKFTCIEGQLGRINGKQKESKWDDRGQRLLPMSFSFLWRLTVVTELLAETVELKVYQTGKGGEGIDAATFGYYFHSGYDNAYHICTYWKENNIRLIVPFVILKTLFNTYDLHLYLGQNRQKITFVPCRCS